MANDTSNTANGSLVQADMDDILSSIRSGVEEEGGKVGSGSSDLIDAAAAADGAEDDVLELSETDMVAAENPASEPEELIDLDAFGASGEAVAVTGGVAAVADELLASAPAPDTATVDAADEFDRLLAEISQEQKQQVVASQISKDALMAEEEPLGEIASAVDAVDMAMDVPAADGEVLVDSAVGDVAAAELPAVEVEPVVAAAAAAMPMVAGKSFNLGAVDGPEGVQIAFPAEVLAMALRPMVQEWLAKNLPDVVERLVKEEISKLTRE